MRKLEAFAKAAAILYKLYKFFKRQKRVHIVL